MSDNTEQNADDLDRQARAWVARTIGERSAVLQKDLNRWRRQSSKHEDAYQKAVRLQQLANVAAEELKVGPPPIITRRRILAGGIAAAGSAHIAGVLGFVPTWRVILTDHATGRGEQARIDTSAVDIRLDGQSSLDADLASGKLRLLEGAAFFATKSSQKVSVEAGTWMISASDAAFSVQHTAEDIEVASQIGTIDVSGLAHAKIAPGQSKRLTVGGLGPTRAIAREEVAAWRTGRLVFRDRALKDVIAELNRHRRGRIVILDTDLADRSVNGVFQLADADTILDSIALGLSLDAINLPGGVTLLS